MHLLDSFFYLIKIYQTTKGDINDIESFTWESTKTVKKRDLSRTAHQTLKNVLRSNAIQIFVLFINSCRL